MLDCFHSRFSYCLIKSNLVFLTNPFLNLQTVTFVHLKSACSFLVMLLLGWTKGLRHGHHCYAVNSLRPCPPMAFILPLKPYSKNGKDDEIATGARRRRWVSYQPQPDLPPVCSYCISHTLCWWQGVAEERRTAVTYPFPPKILRKGHLPLLLSRVFHCFLAVASWCGMSGCARLWAALTRLLLFLVLSIFSFERDECLQPLYIGAALVLPQAIIGNMTILPLSDSYVMPCQSQEISRSQGNIDWTGHCSIGCHRTYTCMLNLHKSWQKPANL